MKTTNLEKLSLEELTELLHELYDGNSGEILQGFQELRLSGEELKAAIIRYIQRAL